MTEEQLAAFRNLGEIKMREIIAEIDKILGPNIDPNLRRASIFTIASIIHYEAFRIQNIPPEMFLSLLEGHIEGVLMWLHRNTKELPVG